MHLSSSSRVRRTCAFLALALPLAACGGGSGGGAGGGGGNVDLTAVLPIVMDNRTGTMTSVPEIFNVAQYSGHVALGDDFVFGSDYDTRGFLTFDLSSLPPGAVISSAVVHLGAQVHSGNPYAVHGLPLVDHVFMSGPNLTLASFSGNTTTAGIALFPTFTTGAFQQGEFDATAAVRLDFEAGRSTASFRVYFANSPEPNSLDDIVFIEVSTTDALLRPTVVVTYR